jgi:hypothetical protein
MTTEATENLIEFWRQCSLEGGALCHPDDKQCLGSKLADTGGVTFSQFITSDRFGTHETKFHLSLYPVPFTGDLRRADIFLLALNPGCDSADYWTETEPTSDTERLCYRDRLKRNIRQDLEEMEYLFFALDPKFAWSTGFVYWERKLGEVVWTIAKSYFENDYRMALQNLACRLAVVELVPYRSQAFGAHSLIKNLPSVKAAKDFVAEAVLPAARAGKAMVIVTRQAESWGIPVGSGVTIYGRGEARGASLSPRTKGGEAILKFYEARPPQ